MTQAAEPALPEALEVRVLIYSGRPDPVFTITDPKEIKQLLDSARALPAAATATGDAAYPKLGYRGMLVTNHSKQNPELASFIAHRNSVRLQPSAGAATTARTSAEEARVDGAGTLEQRLLTLAQAKGVLSPAALTHIQNQR